MKPIDQQTKIDCYRACLASILEISLEDVPEFSYNAMQLVEASKWLSKEKRCTLLGFNVSKGSVYCIPAMYHIMNGKSPRDIEHAVVGFQGVMVHDPHRSKEGIKEPSSYEFIIPADFRRLFRLSVKDYESLPDRITDSFELKTNRLKTFVVPKC